MSVSYLRYAAQGYFASPLLHFVHALSCPKRTAAAIDSLLALGHTSGADTLLGFWLGQQLLQGNHENTGCGSWGQRLTPAR